MSTELTQVENRSEEASPSGVVLALGNELQRYGIERMLQSLGDVGPLRVRHNPSEAVSIAADYGPTIFIVSLREIDHVAAAKLREAADQGSKIIVLVDDADLDDLSRLATISSSGILAASDLNAKTLKDALTRVRAGEMPLSPSLAHGLVARASMSSHSVTRPQPTVRLTPREQEVLILLVDGLSNKQIARRLSISVHGAKRLVANILAKLDCSTRTLAVAKALREGIYEQYARQA